MATQTFQETDDVASCAVMTACAPAGGTISSQASDFAMRVGGTPGSVAESFDIPAGSSRYGVFFQSDATEQTDWPSGNWTVSLNVSTAQNNTAWTGVWVCRIDDACGTVASVGSETTSTDISAGGVFSKTVTAGAATTGAATDRVYVVCEFTNSHSMTARTIGVTPSETVTSPIPEPAVAQTIAPTAESLTSSEPSAVVSPSIAPRAESLSLGEPAISIPRTIAGTVYAPDGTVQSGATVHIINTTASPSEHVATLTTDANGEFTHETTVSGDLHVTAQYDDGAGAQYNALSHHSLRREGEGGYGTTGYGTTGYGN